MAKAIVMLKGMSVVVVILLMTGCTPMDYYCNERTEVVIVPSPEVVIVPLPDVYPCPQPDPLPPSRVKEPPRQDRTADVPTRIKTGPAEYKAPKQPVRGRGKTVTRSR